MRLLPLVSLFLLLFQAAPQPTFDIADVHTATSTGFTGMQGPILRGERYEIRNATMAELVMIANNATSIEYVLGGPSWMENNRYDVIAKMPAGTSRETAQIMLRNLLADRFGLAVHKDKKPVPLYVLSPGKDKHKLKATQGEEPGCKPKARPDPGYLDVECRNMTSAQLTMQIRQMAAGYLNRTMLDATKLEGSWDFDLKWTARNNLPAAGADGISIFDAVEKQLGLKLALEQVPSDVVMVDRVNEKPTENPAELDKIPEAPKEFEVATIKPSASPDSVGAMMRFNAGRIDADAPLRDLIVIALDIPERFHSDLLIGPKFLETERFAIVAKAPAIGPERALPPIVELQTMLKNLIIEKFELKSHVETREATVYALLPGKGEHKLRKGDPSQRGSCRLDVAAGKPFGIPGAHLCQNTTLPELAKLIESKATAYIDHPVVDLTGIAGGWEFALGWTPRAQLEAGRSVEVPGVTTTNPTGMTPFEAVEKLLGLRLELQKRPIQVTVIDHVLQKPKD